MSSLLLSKGGKAKPSLKIWHKGMILVAVPLVFQLLFVGLLWALLINAKQQVEEAQNVRAAIEHAQKSSDLFDQASTSLSDYATSGNLLSATQFSKKMESMETESKALAAVVLKDPNDSKLQRVVVADAGAGSKYAAEFKATIADRTAEVAQLGGQRLAPLVATAAKQLKDDVSQLSANHPDGSAAIPQSVEASIQTFLQIAIGTSALVTFGLAILFTRGITRRLRVLSDNSYRLAAGKTLNPQVEGSDEVAYVDDAFHSMARAMEEAKEKEQKLEALKREFVAMITHDLRTPLTSIQLFLELIAEGAYEGRAEKLREKARFSESDTERLIRLINSLLDIEKMEAGKFEVAIAPCVVAKVVERSVESVKDVAERKGVMLTTEACEGDFDADDERLVQVIINLLSNAIKFSAKGQTVSVSAQRNNGFVEFKVADQGRGIPEEARAKIFDRFEQVELSDARLRGGTGLGLAICQAIVSAHHGEIGVDSEEGKGSTFWFRIPAEPHI